jgi:hypothetical protein
MSWRTLRLLCACGVLAASAAPACGGSASDPQANAAGSAGRSGAGNSGNGSIPRAGTAGTGSQPSPVSCGSKSCTAVMVPTLGFVAPCCADAKTNQSGLDSSVLDAFGTTFSETCQPLAQPGTKDPACADSPATPVEGTGLSLSFPGCCRPNNRCGYQMDSILGVVQLGLGCVDAAPFLDGEAPQSCGETGAAGASGAGGESGYAGESSSAGAGGDSSGAGSGGDFGGAGSGG